MNHSTVCMKREALEKSGSYETVLYMEDYYLWAKMLANGFKIENFKEPLVHFRVGKDFCAKRNEKVKIKGWKKLQKLMKLMICTITSDCAANKPQILWRK